MVTVDRFKSALSDDPLGVKALTSTLQPLPPPPAAPTAVMDVPEDVSRRMDAEGAAPAGGNLTDFASSLTSGFDFLPTGSGEDANAIDAPLAPIRAAAPTAPPPNI